MEKTMKKLVDFFGQRDENGAKVSDEETWIDEYGTSRILRAEFEKNG